MSAFEKVTTAEKLIAYLEKKAKGLHDTEDNEANYVYHYTNKDSVFHILGSKQWYIGSPMKMNDGLEKGIIERHGIDNLFFASFVEEDKESIGMWSMYSQPWEEGVVIKIPIREMKEWMEAENTVHACKKGEKTVDSTKGPIENKVTFHAIAYSNAEALKKSKAQQEILECGKPKNSNFKDTRKNRNLAGYIKDEAWSYEHEMRLRVEAKNESGLTGVIINIPDYVIEKIEFITGPRFEGDLLNELRSGVDGILKGDPLFEDSRVQRSTFDGRLTWVCCDDCKKKCDYCKHDCKNCKYYKAAKTK